MAARPIFEDFDAALAEAAVRPDLVSRDQVEASERAAYEQGYSAGWDDAQISQAVQVTASFAYWTRFINGLGIKIGNERIGKLEATTII